MEIKRQIFLNKKYLVKWTEKKTAFAVQSPLNLKAVIWWAKEWFQVSKKWSCKDHKQCLGVGEVNPGHSYCPTGYFATACIFNKDYEQIIYGQNGVEEIIPVSGQVLYKAFTEEVAKNSKQYLQQAEQLQTMLSDKDDKWLRGEVN